MSIGLTRGRESVVALLVLLALTFSASLSAAGGVEDRAFLRDRGQAITLQELLNNNTARDWNKLADSKTLNLGFTDDAVWVRFSVSPDDANRVLEIGYPLLDSVDVYWVRKGRVLDFHRTGSDYRFATRPIYHRNFVSLVPKMEQAITGYIRVQTNSSMQIPFQVIPSARFLADDQLTYGWQMLFTGIMLALALYNFVLFFVVRHLAYLWYALSVVTTGLIQLTLHGITFQWLWPGMPGINDQALLTIMLVNGAFIALFTAAFLHVHRYSRWLWLSLQGVAALSGILFVVSFFLTYQTGIQTVITFAVIVLPFLWFAGFYAWYRGETQARIYVLAWTMLLLGLTALALSKAGILPRTTGIEYAPQFGAALEVILLSFALAYQIKLERSQRYQAQAAALNVQREANQLLESRVAERTQALEVANERLHSISVTDGLTGVANRRRFDEVFQAEWRRNARQRSPLSLLMLDLDHFKQVNDVWGHLCGDACLMTAAEICKSRIMREGDLVARYGGEEFVVLLPHTDEAGALAIAETIRRSIETHPMTCDTGKEVLHLTISIGVAWCVPDLKSDPEQLIKRADEALYESKGAGRNRVMLSGADGVRPARDTDY